MFRLRFLLKFIPYGKKIKNLLLCCRAILSRGYFLITPTRKEQNYFFEFILTFFNCGGNVYSFEIDGFPICANM